MNAISVFNFSNNEVRVMPQGQDAWFVATDACKALGLSNPTRALATLDDDEKMVLTIGKGQKKERGGAQSYNLLNESGMYHLVFKSRKKEAVTFRKWVTSEVLPSIRKTGTYTLPDTITPKQKLSIRDAMAKKVYDNYGKKQIPSGFKTEWHDFYEAFEISKYEELPASRFDDAMGYILGEWIPETEQLALADGMIAVPEDNIKAMKKITATVYDRHQEHMPRLVAHMDVLQASIETMRVELDAYRYKTNDSVREAKMIANLISTNQEEAPEERMAVYYGS